MTYTLIPLKVLCLLTIFCLYGSLSYASGFFVKFGGTSSIVNK